MYATTRLLSVLCVAALTACDELPPDDGLDGGAPDAGLGPAACPTVTTGPQSHANTISADEVWAAENGPHLIPGQLTLAAGVTLTIAPCSEVLLGAGASFVVNGRLVARGDASHPIRFARQNPASRFQWIWVRSPGSAELAYAELEGGGAAPNSTLGTTLYVEGGPFPPAKMLFVDHVTVKSSAGYGVRFSKWAAFADGSTALTITGAGQESTTYPYPLRMQLNAAASIPPGSYVGNAVDEIQLVPESPHYDVELDEVLRARAVPYHVGGNGAFGLITVKGSSTPTLTVEPGVVVKFESITSNVGGLFVGGSGSSTPGRLVAVGMATAPITFTGTQSQPGSWEGITFLGALAAGNALDYVIIDAAGAHGGDTGYGCPPSSSGSASDGALKLFSEPGASFLGHSTISNSSTHGVFSAWSGTPVDFKAGNTFTNVAGCAQVLPKSANGICPSSPSCQ